MTQQEKRDAQALAQELMKLNDALRKTAAGSALAQDSEATPDEPEDVRPASNRETAADIIRMAMETAADEFDLLQDKLDSPAAVLAFMQETYAPMLLKLSDALAKVDPLQPVKTVVDGREVFNAVVVANNRAIKRTGEDPVRVDAGVAVHGLDTIERTIDELHESHKKTRALAASLVSECGKLKATIEPKPTGR